MFMKISFQIFLGVFFFQFLLMTEASILFERQYKLKKDNVEKMKNLMLDVIALKAYQNDLNIKDLFYLSLLIIDIEKKKEKQKQRNMVYWYSRQG
jgi:hypothetical protein